MSNSRSVHMETVLRSFIGTADYLVIIVVVLLLMTLGWSADGVRDWFIDLESTGISWPKWNISFILIFPFPILLLLIYAIFKLKAKSLLYQVKQIEIDMIKPLSLVIYLSNLRNRNVEAEIKNLDDPQIVSNDPKSQHPWKMSILAIKQHLPDLEKVIAITSSGEGGSTGDWEKFVKSVENCWPQHTWELHLADEFLGHSSNNGVDFEDLHKLVETTYTVVDKLRNKHKRKQILIDVTGGTKMASVAGSAVALEKMQYFQYIKLKEDGQPNIKIYFATYKKDLEE